MAQTYRLDDRGNVLTIAAGPRTDDGPLAGRLLRLEVFGLMENGGALVFLDANARRWLRERLDEWDR
jgi:hypothetical protein